MALHRDIHWIGRQWAVTGHGMQLIDQKLQGFFDIEVLRLWDESLIETMHAKEWLNAADFDKGLAVARARFPQSMLPVTPLPEVVQASAIEPIAPSPPVARPEAPKRDVPPKLDKPAPVAAVQAAPSRPGPVLPAAELTTPDPIGPSQEKPADLHMRFDGYAKFVRPWRAWMKRQT
jgi:hypothetical protein